MRLLLVEDEERLASSIARGLRQASHAVDIAVRVAEARRKIGSEPYDAVILDVMLPDGSGFDLAREIRAAGHHYPVILMTARDSVEDRVHGLDLGADDYLVKPVAIDELLARLRAIARRTPELRPNIRVVGDLIVDPAARNAQRGGKTIELTTTEFALLDFLSRRVGQVCTRTEIANAVWDEHFDPLSNIIDVYIARLRRKIDMPGLRALLHTVRGTGYVIDPERKG
jgi:DNA-binding response OmpR family regulator